MVVLVKFAASYIPGRYDDKTRLKNGFSIPHCRWIPISSAVFLPATSPARQIKLTGEETSSTRIIASLIVAIRFEGALFLTPPLPLPIGSIERGRHRQRAPITARWIVKRVAGSLFREQRLSSMVCTP